MEFQLFFIYEVHIKNEIFSARLPNETTTFTAVVKAIQLAF
jgi:hypothetical protein